MTLAAGFALTTTVDTLGVSGVLSFATAAPAWQAMRAQLAADGKLRRLDLAGVQNSDSAGLSCIMAILAESVRSGRPVKAVGVPPGMLALAKVCEVDHLLTS